MRICAVVPQPEASIGATGRPMRANCAASNCEDLTHCTGIAGTVAWTVLVELRPDIPRLQMWPTNYWSFVIVPVPVVWFAILKHGSRRE